MQDDESTARPKCPEDTEMRLEPDSLKALSQRPSPLQGRPRTQEAIVAGLGPGHKALGRY